MSKKRHWFIYLLKFLIHLSWILVVLALIYFAIVSVYSWLEKHTPAAVESVSFVQSTSDQEIYFFDDVETFIRIVSWDIGYACRGRYSDSYREGGNQPFPDNETYQKYLQGVVSTIDQLEYADIILLQHVDIDSRRSRYINQHEMITQMLEHFGHGYSLNASSPFVMHPFHNPEGKIRCAMSTFSRLPFEELTRVALPPVYQPYYDPITDAPCFQLSRFSLRNGTFLVVLNIQNLPLRQFPGLRLHHLQVIKSFMLDEYLKGNFVVAGGNWQVNPAGYNFSALNNGDKGFSYSAGLEAEFFSSGWQVIFDPEIPSKRFSRAVYKKGISPTTITDFFVISPNIEVHTCKTLDAGFEYSDHNPILLEIYIPLDKDAVVQATEE